MEYCTNNSVFGCVGGIGWRILRKLWYAKVRWRSCTEGACVKKAIATVVRCKLASAGLRNLSPSQAAHAGTQYRLLWWQQSCRDSASAAQTVRPAAQKVMTESRRDQEIMVLSG